MRELLKSVSFVFSKLDLAIGSIRELSVLIVSIPVDFDVGSAEMRV